VINGKGHSFETDWWSLGVLMYELLVGETPFKSKNPKILFNQITKEDIKIPEDLKLSPECQSFLFGLLNRDYRKRLGYLDGAEQLLEHSFLASIDKE
jgi:serine/threonine protein kinase